MTEPRTPGDPGQEPTAADAGASEAGADAANPATPAQPAIDSPTQPWPSLSPSSGAPSASSWGPPTNPPAATPAYPPPPDPAPTDPTPIAWEPADRLPDQRLGVVDETTTFGATPTTAAAVAVPPATRSRSGLRWGLALLGVLIVIGATALIVYLAGSRPAATLGVGYMPATTAQYSEIRLDLPGDQRTKLAGFLANFPGFKDQTQVEPKINDVLDRLVRAATNGKQTYATDIAPWFGGQVSTGSGLPATAGAAAFTAPDGMGSVNNMLVVISIKDRAKAEAWLTSTATTPMPKAGYNGADVWTQGTEPFSASIALTDQVMLIGSIDAVHAAIDSKGQGGLGDTEDFKAAMAQIDRDYVALSLVRTKPWIDGLVTLMASQKPGLLEGSQLDETITAMIPAWQATMGRFESDSFVSSTVYPSPAIGFDAQNHKSTLVDHLPATTILYAESHDIGPALKAVLDKFRALPEAKAAFQAFDQALSILGGFDATLGWWGDTALVVAPGPGGVIGGGLVIAPRDKAAADRLVTTIRGFITIAGGSSGISLRDEDHAGTKISILDFSAAPGVQPSDLPPGYKAEFALAVSSDVVVLGYGRDFVASILDAAPGSNLASNDRFKKLVGRVGEENLGQAFLDVNAIRGLLEPLMQQAEPATWATYQTEFRPYLEHLDAVVSAVHRDGALDRGAAALTTR